MLSCRQAAGLSVSPTNGAIQVPIGCTYDRLPSASGGGRLQTLTFSPFFSQPTPTRSTAAMRPSTIYTRTGKGILAFKKKTVKLARDLRVVFLALDGKASIGELLPDSGLTESQFEQALVALEAEGYIKVFSSRLQARRETSVKKPSSTSRGPASWITRVRSPGTRRRSSISTSARRRGVVAEKASPLPSRMRTAPKHPPTENAANPHLKRQARPRFPRSRARSLPMRGWPPVSACARLIRRPRKCHRQNKAPRKRSAA